MAPFFLAFLAALALIGCGGSTGDDTATGGSGNGGSGTGGSGNGSGTGGSATGGSAAGGTGSGGSGTGGSATGGTGAGGSGVCTTDTDCADGICGFPTSAGCTAKGQCFPEPTALCDAYSPGCACDGSDVNLICEGLPDGYAKKPVAHAGNCQGGAFACGDGLECDSSQQICKIGMGGPCCGPPSYSCEPIPADCASNYTCACIQKAVGAQECDETGGGVTVTFFYP